MEITIKSQKYGEQTIIIDDEDFEKVKGYTWVLNFRKNRNVFYAERTRTKDKDKKNFRMHRLIMDCPEGMTVDHINRNTLDNRKENLRICSNKENVRNSKKRKDGITSKYKGVHYAKKRDVFVSQITVDKEHKFLGHFKNEEDAAIAYNNAAIKYFGEFANLNTIH